MKRSRKGKRKKPVRRTAKPCLDFGSLGRKSEGKKEREAGKKRCPL
jgi:hypothetical protein